MMMQLRNEIMNNLTDQSMEKIRAAPKPTKIAEVLAVIREFKGMAIGLDEIAEIINISDPGRNIKARQTDYNLDDLKKHPEILLVRTPAKTYVRYKGTARLYNK